MSDLNKLENMHQLKITSKITPRDTISASKYFQEVSKFPLLSVEEEIELARRMREGDEEAANKMIQSNLRFVISVSNQYIGSGLDQMDLINEGNIGLIKAVRLYDETRGFKFISYAVWWIRQSIMQAVAEKGRMVRVPLNKLAEQHKIYQFIAEFEQTHEGRPSPEEIAEGTGLPASRIMETLGVTNKHSSLDSPLKDGEDGTLMDVLIADDASQTDDKMEKESMFAEIERALGHLSSRDSDILKLSFGLLGARVCTLDEIGAKHGLSRERVRQVRESAIRKLRSIPSCARLRTFL